MSAREIAANIKMLVLDVDGVLTDAGIYMDSKGGEFKRFNVQDGLGIKTAMQLGLKIGVITGLKSESVSCRINSLGIADFAEGIQQKLPVLEGMKKKYNLSWEEIAYMGDDWIDLAPLSKVGMPIAVDNAQKEVKEAARFVTKAAGGHGAVREAICFILEAQGRLKDAIAHWTSK